MSDDESWRPRSRWRDSRGREELFMHPDIATGPAQPKVTKKAKKKGEAEAPDPARSGDDADQ